MKRNGLVVLVIAAAAAALGPGHAADGDLKLRCEGADRGITGPSGYFRFAIEVDRRELAERHLSLDRFRGGFEAGEPQLILEPITRLGTIEISYCNRDDWPPVCRTQLPSSRDLMVGTMSEPGDPTFLSGYVGCPFCPLAPLQVDTSEAGEIRFRYFEFDLIEGSCRSEG